MCMCADVGKQQKKEKKKECESKANWTVRKISTLYSITLRTKKKIQVDI